MRRVDPAERAAASDRERLLERVAVLERSLERATGALRCVRDGVVVCDETSRVIFRNGTGEASLSSSPSEVIAEQAVREALAAAMSGASPYREIELFGPPRKVLEINAEPIVDHGVHLGAVALVEDVSERKRIDALRRDFVSNISHELRTPVGALLVLAEAMSGEIDADVLQRLGIRVELEAARLARMIDDLLSLTRLESEDGPQSSRVEVEDIVREAIDRAGPASQARNVAIESVPDHPVGTVIGDRRQLVSALFNLIDNAIKYSDAGRSIQVAVHHALPASDERPFGMVCISVADHGIGIPSRDRERIFERFYRVDRARARDTGGTGLGLAIVRHVVTNHGGEIDVHSIEGEGATFEIRFPIAEPADASACLRTFTAQSKELSNAG